MPCRGRNLVKDIVAVDHADLEDGEEDEEDSRRDLNGEYLGVELDQAESGRPVECLPGIEHRDDAGATDNLGLNLASKGSVKRND